MWALRKDQQKLTAVQRGTLAQIAVLNKPLYKGYLIKEQIREAFKVKGSNGKTLMRGVTAWAHRCCIPEFTKLARTLTRHKVPIEATLGGGLSYSGGQIRIDFGGVDHAEVPTSLDELIEQSSRWFIGEIAALHQAVNRYGLQPRLLLRICGLGYWLLGPPCLAVVVVTSLRRQRWPALIALFLTAGVELTSYLRLNKWSETCGLPAAPTPSGLGGYWLTPVLFSLGAFRAITRYRLGYSSREAGKARPDSFTER